MSEEHSMKIIARIHNDFPTKFGIPHQSNRLSALKATIVFEPEYRVTEAFRGLEDYDYIWLIWQFSEAVRENWSPTVRPPRLGGNTRMGVFATRSPFRPNSLGLSSVRLEEIEYHSDLGTVHAHLRGGSDGWNADLRYQTVPSLCGQPSGSKRRLHRPYRRTYP